MLENPLGSISGGVDPIQWGMCNFFEIEIIEAFK